MLTYATENRDGWVDPLDFDQLQGFLNTFLLDRSSDLQVQIFESLPSTNQTLWKLLAQGAKPNTVVIARQQTAGKGQWGRTWQSQTGGLYLSIALAPDLPSQYGSILTLCGAWGIATALRNRRIPIAIKWFNDLYLQGRKLSGILTETRIQQERITQAVMGVGMNWSNPVPETAIHLQSYQQTIGDEEISSLEELAGLVLQGILTGLDYANPEKITEILPDYFKLLLSHQVLVDDCPGTVLGVTSTGELKIRLSSGSAATHLSLGPGAATIKMIQ